MEQLKCSAAGGAGACTRVSTLVCGVQLCEYLVLCVVSRICDVHPALSLSTPSGCVYALVHVTSSY